MLSIIVVVARAVVFGNLHHLMALQTVSLRYPYEPFGLDDYTTEEGWSKLDEVLTQAHDSLTEGGIHAHIDENNAYRLI
jgi:hypothetical protein